MLGSSLNFTVMFFVAYCGYVRRGFLNVRTKYRLLLTMYDTRSISIIYYVLVYLTIRRGQNEVIFFIHGTCFVFMLTFSLLEDVFHN